MTENPVWSKLVSAAKSRATWLFKIILHALHSEQRDPTRVKRWWYVRRGKWEIGGGSDKRFD